MSLLEIFGALLSILLIIFFLRKGFSGLHQPSEDRKQEISELEESIREMQEELKEIKKP